MKSYLSALIVIAGVQLVKLQTDQADCTDTCSCGQSSLAGGFNYPVVTTYTDPKDGHKYRFEFSPCPGYIPCGLNTSKPTIVCQFDASSTTSFSIGTANSITWSVNASDPSQFTVVYGDGDKTSNKQVRMATVIVTYVNQGSSLFNHTKEVATEKELNYIFEAIIAPVQVQESIAGPIGFAIIGILILALIAYFIIGGIVMYAARGARGLEVIPNYSFWKSLPFLIKDGVFFTFSPCLKDCGKKSTYSSLN